MRRIRTLGALVVVATTLPGAHPGALAAQQQTAAELPFVTPADYGQFESLLQPALSPNGAWLAYRIRRVDEEEELRVRPLADAGAAGQAAAPRGPGAPAAAPRPAWTGADSVRAFAWGGPATFSPDSRWAAWSVGVSPDERERLQEAGTPVRSAAALLELESAELRDFADVRAFAFDPSGRFLALHGYAPQEPRGKGADLLVLDLAEGTEMSFGNVAEYAWSDRGSLLALAIATGTEEGGALHLYYAPESRIRVLAHAPAAYRHLSWRDDAADLVLLRSEAPMGADSTAHRVLAWSGLDGAGAERFELPATPEGIADTLRVVGFTAPRWTEDGRRVTLGVRPWDGPDSADDPAEAAGDPGAPEPDADSPDDAPSAARARDDEPELPGLQLWHTRDVLAVSQQQSRLAQMARRTLLAVWTPEGGVPADRPAPAGAPSTAPSAAPPAAPGPLLVIGTDLDENAALTADAAFGIERVSAPYPWGTMFGRPYHDVWLTDVETGERRLALERVRYSWESAEGRYLLTFDGEHYHALELATGEARDLTSGLDAAFANTRYDTPTDLLPPHGVGGWLEGDAAVLLYDRYDVWSVAPDGSGGERVTSGAEDDVIHRVVRVGGPGFFFGASPEPFALDEPLYLSLRGEWTEDRGYARIAAGALAGGPGSASPGSPAAGLAERLLLEPAMLSGLTRADSAEVYLLQEQARDRSPNLYLTGPDLAARTPVTHTNPFLADYAWTRAELVDFESDAGERLQAVLLYPANHDPSRRYPMIVYTYEMLSPQMHSFQAPSERSYYNFTAWTQHEYFVLLPDIRYRARDPGVSALEAVRPAVATTVERGLVDAERVGLIGHSWGGYQATFLPTRTDIFAASVAGAPLTDFVSFMGQIHWSGGAPELTHWETGQGRMEVPYWEDPEAHHRNSPLHRVHEMETPLLMAFGDEDGVVEWWQGTLFYNFARRADRQMVLIVYEGEGHGFQREPNQIDYHRRILEWFGHYLKGEPAPRWITDGIPVAELEEEGRRLAGGDGG